MTAAATQGPQIVTVAFNVPVSVATAVAAAFVAISDDGTVTPGATSVGRQRRSAEQDHRDVPGVDRRRSGRHRTDLRRPLRDRNGDGLLMNLAGTIAASTPNSVPGLTNGPDLLLVSVDAGTSRVTFTYYETVRELAPAASDMQGSAVDGSLITPSTASWRRRTRSRRDSQHRSRAPSRSRIRSTRCSTRLSVLRRNRA